MDVLLIAMILLAASGIAALFLGRSPRLATVFGAGGVLAGSLLGLIPAVNVLLGGPAQSLRLEWDAIHGAFVVEIDCLSAFFLLPLLLLSGLAAVYGGNYLFAYRHEKNLGIPWFFYNLFIASMVLVLVARTVLLFLVAWEVMSLAAYFLVTMEHEKAEVRRAGWIYLIATHLGAIFLFSAFLLMAHHAGSSDFARFRTMPVLSASLAGMLFVLALIGFGAKAGFVPFHVWLPEAHPAAPSHVSAVMSGVMIKMGLYGLLRMITFLGPPAFWWGPMLAVIGMITALVGVALAIQQRDMKRALAYSSIENVGLIALALGIGLWGWAHRLPSMAALGMIAAFLHIWNHSAMKGLMFLAAGSVVHGTGERDVEKLGGVLKRMPWTGNAMLFGALAIAGLPPLNGFISEWLMYLGLMKVGLADPSQHALAPLLSVGLFALIGGLAAFAFVRLTGIALLGSPRSDAARDAHESSLWMIVPMYLLLVACLVLAIVPNYAVGLLTPAVDQVLDQGSWGVPEGLGTLGAFNAGILVAVGLVGVGFLAISPQARQAVGTTWSCGYAKPTVRMQYTGNSFAAFLVAYLLPRFLRPRVIMKAPQGLFPADGEYASECPDPATAQMYEPLFHRVANRLAWLHILQQGKVHVYMFFVMLTVVLALAWVSVRTWWTTT